MGINSEKRRKYYPFVLRRSLTLASGGSKCFTAFTTYNSWFNLIAYILTSPEILHAEKHAPRTEFLLKSYGLQLLAFI